MTAPPDDLGSGLVGGFSWDARRDAWAWSDEMFVLHGYRPQELEPTFDLILGHKAAEGRARAERVMGNAGTTGFRFSNHHRILDVAGRERIVVSVGATCEEVGTDGSPLQVVRGFMVDVSAHHEPQLVAALENPADAVAALSPRERDVLLLLAAGRSNKEIAAELYLGVNTVKTYLRTAYRKIGVSRRSQAVLWTMAHRARLSAP